MGRSWLGAGLLGLWLGACSHGAAGGAIDAGAAADAPLATPDAGAADAAPGAGAHAAGAAVTGGVTAKSPNFKLIGTVGPGDGSASSPSATERSGVVGATQAP